MRARCSSIWNIAFRCCGRSWTCSSPPSPSSGRRSPFPAPARDVLAKLVDGADVSNSGLPFMGVAQTTVLVDERTSASPSPVSWATRSPPARQGERLMEAIMEAGKPFGITPYGTETLGVLRIEKGHVSGSELNGQTSASDLGMGRMVSTKGPGRPRVVAAARLDPERPIFVGFKPVDTAQRLRAGAHFLKVGVEPTTHNDEGYLTSVAYSPTSAIDPGPGFLKRGLERIGEQVRAYDPVRGSDILVEVCSPAFVDPEGEKQRV